MTAPETIRDLADRIRALETTFRPSDLATISLDPGGLGELFPEGLTAGSLVELLPRTPGAGAWTLALLLAKYACGERKTLFITDYERCFYPPAAHKFGLDPKRTILVRPKKPGDALLALGQALRCSAIGAAIGAFERLHDRDARRFQLAAETGGAIGILVRPASSLGVPSFATVRLLLESLPSARGKRRMRLEVIRCRQTASPSSPLALEVDDVTGHVRAFSALELAADSPRTTRSTG